MIATSAGVFWLLMMSIHESGHVLAAWLTGGHIERVVLNPLAISRTDVSPNPSPLFVVCAGPAWGGLVPVVIWLVWRALRRPWAKWFQALAGFCLIANGVYVASGVAFPAGDTEVMIRLGVAPWVLAVVGIPAVLAGLWTWHDLGRGFGLTQMTVDQQRHAAWIAVLGLIVVAGALFAYTFLTGAR